MQENIVIKRERVRTRLPPYSVCIAEEGADDGETTTK